MSLIIASTTQSPIGNNNTFQARLVAKAGSGATVANEGIAITAADVSAIACAVWYSADLETTPATQVDSPAIDSSAISSSLVADNIWTQFGRPVDSIGRNFLHTVAGSVFANVGTYRVVYAITLTDADETTMTWAHEVDCQSLIGP